MGALVDVEVHRVCTLLLGNDRVMRGGHEFYSRLIFNAGKTNKGLLLLRDILESGIFILFICLKALIIFAPFWRLLLFFGIIGFWIRAIGVFREGLQH
jgi:hypothetical protein